MVVASIRRSAEDFLRWRGCLSPNEPLHIDELIPAIISLIPCNADAPLEAELRDRLLAYDETEAASSLSAECLHFEMAGKIMEEGRTVVDGGIESLSLESGWSYTGRVLVGGPIVPLVAMTALLFGAVSTEFAMAPRV